jgi:hypothetical protein
MRISTQKRIRFHALHIAYGLMAAVALLSLVAGGVVAQGRGKPGITSVDTGIIYHGEGDDSYCYRSASGGPSTALPALTGKQVTEPSYAMHGGKRWFFSFRHITGVYPDNRTRQEVFAVSEAGEEVQLSNDANLQLMGSARWMRSANGTDVAATWVARRWDSGTVSTASGIYSVGFPSGLSAALQPQLPTLIIDFPLITDSEYGLVPDVGTFDWSPAMDKVVYDHSGDGISITEALVGPRTTWGPLVTATQGWPRWSPDGSKIAFGMHQILTMNPDGTDVNEIVPHHSLYQRPGMADDYRWSPNGTHLAYVRVYIPEPWLIDRATANLYRIAADGSDEKKIAQKAYPCMGWRHE